jgi:hypothetical protein
MIKDVRKGDNIDSAEKKNTVDPSHLINGP